MPLKTKDQKIPELIEISKLLLDIENFRLPIEEAKGADQEKLMKILERDFELNVIAESLIDNGYFDEEPLISIPGPSDNFIIVEGNRRLATLKFLLQPEFHRISYQPKYWEDAAKRIKFDISRVPILKYSNRQELSKFLGYRHIAGILKWDPLSKARYIDSLVEQKGDDADFGIVARETGSTKPAIRDNYIAHRIYLQAKSDFGIDTSKLEENFSVFYRSLSSPLITDFIGLKKDIHPRQLRKPVSRKKAAVLEELIGYIHGTNKVDAVIRDSRQLTDLGEILDNKEALDDLRRYRDFDHAFQLSGGEERRLKENLKKANRYLSDALKDVHQYKDSKEISFLIIRFWKTALEVIRHFPKVKDGVEKNFD